MPRRAILWGFKRVMSLVAEQLRGDKAFFAVPSEELIAGYSLSVIR